MRMGMIEANDLEAAAATLAPRIDVILGIDQKSVRVAGHIACPHDLVDLVRCPEQHAATLTRPRLSSVVQDCLQRGPS